MNLYEVKACVVARLAEMGFDDTERAYSVLRELLDRAPDRPDLVESSLRSCAASAAPDECLLHFSRFVDHSLSPYTQLRDLVQNEYRGRVAFAIFAASNYLSAVMAVQPTFLDWLFEGGILAARSAEEIREECFALVDAFREREGFLEALNAVKVRHNLLIAARELMGLDTIDVTTAKLSQVADAVLETVYRRNLRDFPASRLAIFALGKLGGGELNFSSDLDLIFVSDREDDDRLDLFGRRIASDLTADTRYGILFRVDMRLRPEGDASPLVTRLGYLKTYFEERARTWERQAYIRARACAGDPGVAAETSAAVSAFVFRSTLTVEDIRSIIYIKDDIDRSVSANPLGHVKKGRGGIRDVEFVVQAFQLLFGARVPELRNPNIFKTLKALYDRDLIPRESYGTLSEAYVFLRRIEHYLQLEDNRQAFELPPEGRGLSRLSRLMGFGTSAGMMEYYSEIRGRTRGIFTKTFSRLFGEGEIAPISEIVMNPEIEQSAAVELLAKYRFEDPASVFRYLRQLASYSPRVEYALALALYFILEEAKDYPNPDRKFFHFFRVMEAYGAYSTFLRLTRYSSDWRNLILNVIAPSAELTRIVTANPGLIDAFIDPESLKTSEGPETLFPRILEMKGGDRRASLERLRNHLFLKTAIRESSGATGGSIEPAEAGRVLSGAVDFIVNEACAAVSGGLDGYCVVALGRLGCREFTYGSDADVVFVYRGGEKQEDYAKLFLDATKYLDGIVELDARLRPDGKSAPLAVSLPALEDYFRTKDNFFEKVAYFKSRVCVCPDAKLRRGVEELIGRFVYSGDTAEDGERIAELRGKIRSAYAKPGRFDIKKDEGGLLDIDFLIFALARRRKLRPAGSNTSERLAGLGEAGVLEAYGFYRRLESALRLNYPGGGSVLPESGENFYLPILKSLNLASRDELYERTEHFRSFVSERLKIEISN